MKAFGSQGHYKAKFEGDGNRLFSFCPVLITYSLSQVQLESDTRTASGPMAMLNPLTQVLDIIQLQNFAKFIFFPTYVQE